MSHTSATAPIARHDGTLVERLRWLAGVWRRNAEGLYAKDAGALAYVYERCAQEVEEALAAVEEAEAEVTMSRLLAGQKEVLRLLAVIVEPRAHP